MEIRSGEDLAKFLRWYLDRNGLTQSAIAKKIGVSQKTFGHWCTGRLRSEVRREKIMRNFPEIFQSAAEMEESVEAKVSDEPKKIDNRMLTVVKIELCRQVIAPTSELLQWFIDASPEARKQFRAELGETWKKFVELMRAMTGEGAREIAIKEGRVQSGDNDDAA